MVWTTLAHHIDMECLRYSFQCIRKSGAAGVDGKTASEYAANLEANLQSLHDRFKEGVYRAPPVRRVHIPKGRNQTRPIGIPTVEDKVLQHAVALVVGAVYEQDFMDCSFGFRPGRSAHDALEAVRNGAMETWGGWVIDLDIASFFDTLDHATLRDFLDMRIRDGVIRRTIGKWLRAGVLEGDELHRPQRGSPQGGVISPLLSNIYLHHVLDLWFEEQVRPRLDGRARLVRYADDAVILFELKGDANRVYRTVPKRLGRFGLTVHATKTRLVDFRQPPPGGRSGTFDFLGMTHYWGASGSGHMIVQRRTSKASYRRALASISAWCRRVRHRPIRVQHRWLRLKLLGHYRYFGVTGNGPQLSRFVQEVRYIWRYWLNRRSSRGHMPWERFHRLLRCYALPPPKIYHRYT